METLQVIPWQHLGSHSRQPTKCSNGNFGKMSENEPRTKKTKNNLTFRGYPGCLIGILSLFDGFI